MRILFLATFCFFCLSQVYSQNLVGKSYITTVDKLVVYPVKRDINTITPGSSIPVTQENQPFYFVRAKTVFIVTGIDKDNNLLVTFPYDTSGRSEFNKNQNDVPTPNRTDDFPNIEFRKKPGRGGPSILESEEYDLPVDAFIGEWANGLAFSMSVSSFSTGAKPFYGKLNEFTWGAMTLPIRVRFGRNNANRFFNFEENLNLGLSAGLRHQYQGTVEHSINFMGGFAISNVKTDSVSLRSGYDSKNQSARAFTINMGVLYQYESFQIGVYLGKDYLPGVLSKLWLYQGKTWVGLVIGVSLFSRNSTKAATATNE